MTSQTEMKSKDTTTALEARDEVIRRFLTVRRQRVAQRSGMSRGTVALLAGASAGQSFVHAIGIGTKGGRKESGPQAVCVFVTRKLPLASIPERNRIPSEINGVPTDVIESPVGRLAATPADAGRGTVRPLVGGISVGRRDGPTGTLGYFVKKRGSEDVFLLSNSHIFSGGTNDALIFQPSPSDGTTVSPVAILTKATRLKLTVPNRVDAAIARLESNIPWDGEVCGGLRVSGFVEATKGMLVSKHGRTTGPTDGVVAATGVAATVVDPFRNRDLQFLDLIRVEPREKAPVAQGGDSGSLILDSAHRAVGLLHAADEKGTFCYAVPIGAVLNEFQIELT